MTQAPVTMDTLVQRVRTWSTDRTARLDCPACAATGLVIVDRSARPHREWYALDCAACGLSRTVAVSLGSSPPGT